MTTQSFARFACVAGLALVTACPALADLNPGDNLQNPQVASLPPFYTTGLPGWYTGAPVAAINPAIAPPSLGTPFIGTVRSEVYFVDGVSPAGGLGFAYRFAIDPSFTADGLEIASFSNTGWAGVSIFDAGSDGSGVSAPVPPPGSPPVGFVNWSDGDPFTISRDASTSAPELRWTGALGGTTINGGQNSAIIWFETDATFFGTSIVTLLDGGVGGSALILAPIPEPTSILLLTAGSWVLLARRRR